MGEGGGPARSEGSREPQDGAREEICRKDCPEFTGFFGCAMPATFARRASLRLRMTFDFDASALRRRANRVGKCAHGCNYSDMVIYPRSEASKQLMISFAQNREDVLIDRVFRKPSGFFIDVGAGHPVLESLTKFFSLTGWRGINIEPAPTCFAELARDRPNDINLRLAVGRMRGTATFHILQNSAMSTISATQLASLSPGERKGEQRVQVEVRTLADICAEFVTGEIDFLKIDAEGAEGDIIAGADWQRFRPRLLVIEATKPWTSELNCAEWEPYLLSQGYSMAYFDGINRYYLRHEDEALAGQLSVPVNVLDCFVTHRELQLQQDLAAHQAELQRLRAGATPAPSLSPILVR